MPIEKMTEDEVCDINAILSPELVEKLGGEGSNQLVISGKKEKRKRSDEAGKNPTVECLVEAKRISKKARKRLEQYQRRQEKESRKAEYLETLQKYEISDVHRSLLTSTREVGQTDTLKQKLSKLLKRYKAGLSLSAEDMELLFPHGTDDFQHDASRESDSMDLDADVPMKESTKIEVQVLSNLESEEKTIDTAQPGLEKVTVKSDTVALNIFDILGSDTNTNNHTEEKQKPKKKKKKSSDANIQDVGNKLHTNVMANEPPKSIGSSILQQLQQLKNKGATDMKAAAPNTTKDVPFMRPSSDESGPSEFDRSSGHGDQGLLSNEMPSEAVQKVYVPVPMEIPVQPYTGMIKASKMKGKEVIGSSVLKRFIQVARDSSIQEKRLLLPVCGMEQEIVEAIINHDVVILCGETGSGKSTQVPQFLYEYGFGRDGMIGITQPRRVAAVSTAERVAFEMNSSIKTPDEAKSISVTGKENLSGIVGYQIRFDSGTVVNNTKIKFMTDGILLREVTSDLLLKQYSVVILDEAHERNINTDILLGMISRTVKLRKVQYDEEMKVWNNLSIEEREEYQEPLKPLKLVIMSATLRVEDFCNSILFPISPPVIKVEARQYPVVNHFSRRTELTNYLHETYRKVSQIHRRLPDGGVLVFVTGKREVMHLCRKLERSLNKEKRKIDEAEKALDEDRIDQSMDNALFHGLDEDEADDDSFNDDNLSDSDDEIDDNDSIDIDVISTNKADNPEEVTQNEELSEEDKLRSEMLREALGIPVSIVQEDKPIDPVQEIALNIPAKAWILPLYAMMPPSQQQLVFRPPPSGHRLIVIATNVAETSITIPGVKYVVDCGRQKERVMSENSGISRYEIKWISKASAEQRKGRAGRTGPGHCYRLYSSAFFDQHMQLFKPAEILSTPLEDLLLQMRAMGISDVEGFPFPTAPPKVTLKRALNLLINIGAIVKPNYKTTSILDSTLNGPSTKQLLIEKGYLTDLGKLLARFPVNPRYAKILVMASRINLLSHGIALISILADKSPFFQPHESSFKNVKEDNSDEESDEDLEGSDTEKAKDAKKSKLLALRYHDHGDALARLKAFGAFSHLYKKCKKQGKHVRSGLDDHGSKEIEKFCMKYGLAQTMLTKATDLQQQLNKLCSAVFSSNNSKTKSQSELSTVIEPPTKQEEIALRQILLTGFCDCIAKKIPPGSSILNAYLSNSHGKLSRRKRMTAYMSCDPNVTEPIYIHPLSSLYQKDPMAAHPEYVIYTSLLRNDMGDTTYMDCVSVISSSWIASSAKKIVNKHDLLLHDCPLLKWSEPLESPVPYYDRETDQIVCYVIPKYGAHQWEFSPIRRPFGDWLKYDASTKNSSESAAIGYRKRDAEYRWFARCLLEGHILPELSKYLGKDKLKDSPSIITDMKPIPKVSNLLFRLITDKISTRKALVKKLKAELSRSSASTYLRDEIQEFLHVDRRKDFRKDWSILDKLII